MWIDIYLLGILLGVLSGLLSRLPQLNSNFGALAGILLLGLFGIENQLPAAFLLPPALAALPFPVRFRAILYPSVALLILASYFFLSVSFGLSDPLEIALHLFLFLSLFFTLLLGLERYNQKAGNGALVMAVALILLQELSRSNQKDLLADSLLLSMALLLLAYLSASRPQQHFGTSGLQFFAYLYLGMAGLIAEDLRDLLLSVVFVSPILFFLLASENGWRYPQSLIHNRSKGSDHFRILWVPMLQFLLGELLLHIQSTWILMALLALLFGLGYYYLKRSSNDEPIKKSS